MDKISIVVPVYNTEKFINRCMESLVNQTYSNIEIILINDGSTDKSLSICNEWSKKDNRVIVIDKKNKGPGDTRNIGIDNASGEYIGFVDSDDFIALDMYETLIKMIKKNNVEVARIEYKETVDNNVKKYKKRKKDKIFNGKIEILNAALKYRFESTCVSLFKIDAIKKIKFKVGVLSEDILFNFEVFNIINSLCYNRVKKYYYYYNPNSTSNGILNSKKLNYIYVKESIDKEIIEIKNKKLIRMSKIVCCRAYVAVLLRMAIYGYDKNEINEQKVLKENILKIKKTILPFLFSFSIPISRKILSIMLLVNYKFTKKILRRGKND